MLESSNINLLLFEMNTTDLLVTSELHRNREDKIFRSRSWNRNREKIFFGVGVTKFSYSDINSEKSFFKGIFFGVNVRVILMQQ
jgi:hypothetical protein